tara:strand:+ start:435 stop:623 length:189 start_codon:yes stop_codon:yes gene_type:complete
MTPTYTHTSKVELTAAHREALKENTEFDAYKANSWYNHYPAIYGTDKHGRISKLNRYLELTN